MAIQPLTARDRDALAEIAHIGAGHATVALTQMRVPRNLLAASSRAAVLMVSP